MKLRFILVVLLFAFRINAQNPSWQWVKAIDSLLFDPGGVLLCSATDSTGNTYVTGSFIYSATFGSSKLVNYGNADVFLLKVDKGGTVIWATSFGGAYGDVPTSIAIDRKGDVIVVGSVTEHIIYLNNQPIAQYGTMVDGYVAKFHPNGSLMFFKRMPGNYSESVLSCCTDSKNNIIIAGNYTNHPGKYPMGPDTLAATGYPNTKNYIAKLNPAGTILWAKNCVANTIIYHTDILLATDNNDEVYVSANVWKNKDSLFTFGSTTYSVEGITDLYLGKLNTNGNELWSHHFAGSSFQYPGALAVDKQGGYIHLAVNFDSPVLKTGAKQIFNQGSFDFTHFKFDIFGNLITVTGFGSPMSENASSFATDLAGNVYCTGTFQGDSLALGPLMAYKHPTPSSTITSDHFIFRTNTNGNIPWVKQIQSTAGIWTTHVTTDEVKNVYVSAVPGVLNLKIRCVLDQDTIYPGSLNTPGQHLWYNFFLAQLYDSTVFLNPLDVSANQPENLFFSPNPANEKISIRFMASGLYYIKIRNELAQTLDEKLVDGKQTEFDLRSLSPGVYLLDILSPKRRITKKLVICR